MASFSFRRRALEQVSSPEELDRLVKVALPRTWIALAGLAALLAAAIAWGVVARVPTSVDGPGYLLRRGGIFAASAPSAGVVHNVLHAARDRVAAGEPLARVRGADGSLETVRSPSTGQLIEVSANRGDYVAAGAPLALVDPVTQPLVVYAYLPQDDAKEARVGDRVEITISEAEPAQFGFLLGRVAAIGAYPATPDRLRSILQDQSVLAEVDQLGPVVETLVHPDPDQSTPSGFRWSQGEGPPYRLTVGTAASVSVVTGQRAPIDYVTG